MMANLFFKVFALILLSAAALFGLVVGFFYVVDGHNRFHHDYEYAHRIARAAVAEYEARGAGALDRHLDALQRRSGLRGFLMRADGSAIGRPLPRFARRQITHFPQTIHRAQSPRGARAMRAVSVATVDNRHYRFVMLAQRRGGAGLWAHPAMRVAMPLLMMALASLLISRLITRPLGKLKSATQNFSGGDLTARPPRRLSARRDAFGELARAFHKMSARIEKLVREQRRLLRDVSHELRTPLSRMQVAATLLEDKLKPAGGPAHPEIARIQIEILRLDGLLTQLLSLTGLAAAARKRQAVEVRSLLEQVIADAAYEFSGGGKSIAISPPAGPEIIILADAEQLRSAFENVIRNGLHYAASAVAVRVEGDPGAASMACISVRDDGPGVPEKELRRLFEAFYRPDQSRTAATGGAGLGLAIARRIVDRHGGSIAAASHADGGLIVTIELPRA